MVGLGEGRTEGRIEIGRPSRRPVMKGPALRLWQWG